MVSSRNIRNKQLQKALPSFTVNLMKCGETVEMETLTQQLTKSTRETKINKYLDVGFPFVSFSEKTEHPREHKISLNFEVSFYVELIHSPLG